MKGKSFIILVIGFASTLVFELFGEGIRRDWFLGADIIYPNIPAQWGEMAGKHALTLMHYLDDIGEHLHVITLYLYIFINTSHDKPIFGILLIFFFMSLLNYIYNYHQPLFWKFDMNYAIIGFMILVLLSKGKEWWK